MTSFNNKTAKLSAWRRKLDSFIGPGATLTEIALQFIPPTLFCLYVVFFATQTGVHKFVSSILAFDLLGGVITNSTTAAKLWYHRSDRTNLNHLSFVAPHVIHIVLVAAIFRNIDLFFFVTASLYLAVASVTIVNVDLYIRKPVAMMLYCGAVLLDNYVWMPTPQITWFVPLFFLKLLVSHLLPS